MKQSDFLLGFITGAFVAFVFITGMNLQHFNEEQQAGLKQDTVAFFENHSELSQETIKH